MVAAASATGASRWPLQGDRRPRRPQTKGGEPKIPRVRATSVSAAKLLVNFRAVGAVNDFGGSRPIRSSTLDKFSISPGSLFCGTTLRRKPWRTQDTIPRERPASPLGWRARQRRPDMATTVNQAKTTRWHDQAGGRSHSLWRRALELWRKPVARYQHQVCPAEKSRVVHCRDAKAGSRMALGRGRPPNYVARMGSPSAPSRPNSYVSGSAGPLCAPALPLTFGR